MPNLEPISVDEVKKQLRLLHCEDDDYLLQLIKAARIKAELFLSMVLVRSKEEEEIPIDIKHALLQWVIAAYDAKDPLSLSQLLLHRRTFHL